MSATPKTPAREQQDLVENLEQKAAIAYVMLEHAKLAAVHEHHSGLHYDGCNPIAIAYDAAGYQLWEAMHKLQGE